MRHHPLMAHFGVFVGSLLLLGGCGTSKTQATAPEHAQLFSGMGHHTRPVAGASPEAQKYFNQGLTWTYAFNHDEAIRSFTYAAQLSPDCAMAWWGVALCHGPHINFPMMPEERSKAAWEALEKAKAGASHASPTEKALIDALSARYTWPIPADRAPLDRAYADAMREVYRQYPNDQDVATLYAESMMDLQPWDLWTHAGEPKGNATEIVTVLEGVLAANPQHPGAAHLYIHAVEASKTPQRAMAAADTLRTLVPASGHLVHMPSHIDIRVGEWPEAAVANQKAIAADTAYRKLSPQQGFYRAYMMHNDQFLSFACMMQGRSKEAIAAGRRAVEMLPKAWVEENAGGIDGYMTVYMDSLKRFGKWDELLSLEAPQSCLPFTGAMWRFNRAVALAAKGDISAAERERERFEEACRAVPEGAMAQKNPASRVLSIAQHVLNGEIAFAERDYSGAINQLTKGIDIEDQLDYMEPPDWMLPVRHTLGMVYMTDGRFTDAERVYREDLARWPENGWSLLGLSRALEAQGKSTDAAEIKRRFEIAWAKADIQAHASCLCAPKGR